MTLIEISKDYYRLALDQYGAPAFDIENFKLIYTFLQYDSNYSSVENEKHPQYQYTYAAMSCRIQIKPGRGGTNVSEKLTLL